MPCPAPDPAPDRAPDRPPDLPPDLPRYAPDDPNGHATLCAPDDACDNCANGVFVEEGYPCGCEHPSMVLCNTMSRRVLRPTRLLYLRIIYSSTSVYIPYIFSAAG